MTQDPLARYRTRDLQTAARLEADPAAGDYRRRQGFSNAAIILLEAAEAQNAWQDRDPLLLPALFTFRHYVELTLKRLAQVAEAFGSEPPKKIHDLSKLWSPVRSGFERCFPTDDDAIRRVEHMIAVLETFDLSGECLRYARRGNGTSSIPEDIYLDPAALLSLVRETIEILEPAQCGFLAQVEYEREVAETYHPL